MPRQPKWPTHPDGTPKKMGQITKRQQLAQTRAAIRRLQPEFKALRVGLEFGGEIMKAKIMKARMVDD